MQWDPFQSTCLQFWSPVTRKKKKIILKKQVHRRAPDELLYLTGKINS